MSGQLLKFRRPAAKRVESKRAGGTRVTGFGLSLQARPGAVVFVADGIQLELSPAQARELAESLVDVADDAESTKTEPKA